MTSIAGLRYLSAHPVVGSPLALVAGRWQVGGSWWQVGKTRDASLGSETVLEFLA
jgi:hypothetical protein